MMRPPRFTLVTVTLNCRDGLAQTLDSVLQQTYPDIEHVVIDGASRDGTRDLAEKRAKQIATFISEPDAGLYDAMNKGLDRASGDFVFFLNASDRFQSPKVLEEVATGIADRDAVYFGSARISTRLGQWTVPLDPGSFQNDGTYLPHHQSIFYPRQFYANNRYDLSFRTHADVEFTYRAMTSCQAYYLPLGIVDSTMGGFATDTFRSFSKTKRLYGELLRVSEATGTPVTSATRARVLFNTAAKFVTCKLFGDAVFYQLYRLNARRQFARIARRAGGGAVSGVAR